MANPEHLAILKKGVAVWNKWREENPEVKPDIRQSELGRSRLGGANLSGADLSEANLNGSYLIQADLSRADLRKTSLGGATLSEANLRGVNFSGAYLSLSNLYSADLHEANLSEAILYRSKLNEATLNGANLYRTNFNEVILDGADFRNTQLQSTIFGDVDLSRVINLEAVDHLGPSTIGINTLFKAQGIIPEAFLKGCGVPDQMIEYAKSLTANPIEYYSCFISYSDEDEDFAKRLHNDLQAAGVRCWFAPHDIKGGKKIHHQIDEAIRVYDKLLLILSSDSMNSNWVETEIIKARKKELQKEQQMFFPISIVSFSNIKEWELFDSDSGKDLAKEIREYHIPDFSHWKKDHDAYSTAFERLLRDLKAGRY